MTRAAKQYLEDAFSKAQKGAIEALKTFRTAQEVYDAKRRAKEECSLEYAIYCDASRRENAASEYASACLMAIESSRLLPTTEG